MNPDRLIELVNARLDGRLDDEGERELVRILDEDAEARRIFVRMTDQERGLRELLAPASVRSRRPRAWILAGAAAAALLVGALAWLLLKSETPPSVVRETPPRRETPPVPPPARQIDPPVLPTPPPVPTPTPAPPLPPPVAPKKADPVPPPVAPEREPERPQPPVPPPLPPPPPVKETIVAVARLESAKGDVFVISSQGQRPLRAGADLLSGQGIETAAGQSAAVVVFPDATRLELLPGTTINEISLAGGKRVFLAEGSILADVPEQPPGQPMILATRHAEAAVLGTRLALSCDAATKLEVKDGRVRLTRIADKAAVEVRAGQTATAAKGVPLAAKRTTRGFMMPAPALWGEDFQDAGALERDWRISRNGLAVATAGAFEADLRTAADADASASTQAAFAAPIRVAADVEFTHRLRGTLVALRLHPWKGDAKDFVHCDLDEDRYYLMVGDQTVTAESGRKTPRRERWSVDLHADGTVVFSVDGRELLKAKRTGAASDHHVTLLVKAKKETPAGARVRFDNVVIEKLK